MAQKKLHTFNSLLLIRTESNLRSCPLRTKGEEEPVIQNNKNVLNSKKMARHPSSKSYVA